MIDREGKRLRERERERDREREKGEDVLYYCLLIQNNYINWIIVSNVNKSTSSLNNRNIDG